MRAADPLGKRVPAEVEQDEQWFDALARRDGDEPRETALESSVILGPELIVQEDPHRVEPGGAGPAQLGVDALGVEGVGLKHLQLIDGV